MSQEILRTIAYVTTPIALMSFLAAIAYFAYARRLKNDEAKLRALSNPTSSAALEDWLIKVGLDLGNVTREQKFELARTKLAHDANEKQQASKDKRLYAILALLATVILFLIAALAFYLSENKPTKAKAEFDFEHAFRANGPELPTDLFGSPQDYDGMPRLWMRLIEAGAPEIIQTDANATKCLWLWSEPFEDRYYSFTAHIYTGTDKKVTACAFLVEPARPPKATPLRRITGLELKGLALFEVPTSPRNSRLLVFLAMNNASFTDPKKIHIRSEGFKTAT